MATVVIMPKVGISVESCIITKWHKKKGETVKSGELLFSYETDKASVDEEASVDGVLLEVFCVEGDDVPVLSNVCIIGNAGEDISALVGSAPAKEEPAKVVEEIKAAPAPQAVIAPVNTTPNDINNVKISPRAQALANSHGVDIRFVTPTGPNGRIIERDILNAANNKPLMTKAAADMNAAVLPSVGTGIGGRITVSDVLAATAVPVTKVEIISTPEPASAPVAAPAPAPAPAPIASTADYTAVKLSNVRKFIAKSMVASLSTMAQLTLNLSFDATKMIEYRKMLKESGSLLGLTSVTLNDMLLYAVAKTIKNHKDLNAHLIDDTMYYFNSVNLGIAVDTDRGLMVPTLMGADKMTLGEISAKAKEIITASQSGTISPDLLKGATFTITNLGTLDIESFTPVINPPQTGILGVCTITQKVKEVDGSFVSYPSMGLSLTFDHRAIDGAPAARFLKELKINLENFGVLLAK
jgi:pyruvate dehydrogenase E2 component (dihydrolipoamide acetyltransferase)